MASELQVTASHFPSYCSQSCCSMCSRYSFSFRSNSLKRNGLISSRATCSPSRSVSRSTVSSFDCLILLTISPIDIPHAYNAYITCLHLALSLGPKVRKIHRRSRFGKHSDSESETPDLSAPLYSQGVFRPGRENFACR